MSKIIQALASVLVAISMCFGYISSSNALTYDEINSSRASVGLAPLSGNNQVDFATLYQECYAGYSTSCKLANILQQIMHERGENPYPREYFDVDNILEGLPRLSDVPDRDSSDFSSRGSSGTDGSSRSEQLSCIQGCQRKCTTIAAVGGSLRACRAEEEACKSGC